GHDVDDLRRPARPRHVLVEGQEPGLARRGEQDARRRRQTREAAEESREGGCEAVEELPAGSEEVSPARSGWRAHAVPPGSPSCPLLTGDVTHSRPARPPESRTRRRPRNGATASRGAM